ncbi:MAG: S26 family signal peptidase, partial [Amphiplicatus sp.]
MTRRGRTMLVATVAGSALITAAALINPHPFLVWNATASAPLGLYRTGFKRPQTGDYVFLRLDGEARELAVARGYLPRNVPAIKQIAAAQGDEICRRASRVFINGSHSADALARDSFGRPMPVWEGCWTLQAVEVFLLNAHPLCFDGRYFGAGSAG